MRRYLYAYRCYVERKRRLEAEVIASWQENRFKRNREYVSGDQKKLCDIVNESKSQLHLVSGIPWTDIVDTSTTTAKYSTNAPLTKKDLAQHINNTYNIVMLQVERELAKAKAKVIEDAHEIGYSLLPKGCERPPSKIHRFNNWLRKIFGISHGFKGNYGISLHNNPITNRHVLPSGMVHTIDSDGICYLDGLPMRNAGVPDEVWEKHIDNLIIENDKFIKQQEENGNN